MKSRSGLGYFDGQARATDVKPCKLTVEITNSAVLPMSVRSVGVSQKSGMRILSELTSGSSSRHALEFL